MTNGKNSVLSTQLTRAIEGVVAPYVDKGSIAGAVTIVADKDGVLAESATGYANTASRKPMEMDTFFWIASQTKPITATALMILVDEGKVRLDDPIAKHLPEFKAMWVIDDQDDEHIRLVPAKRDVTIRDFLSHMGGLPFTSALEEPTLDIFDLSVTAGSYAMSPLNTHPGTRMEYSNAGINVAGRIIEVVTGVPYEKFLRDRLFDPLGLTETTFFPTKMQIENLATSYKPNAGGTGIEETNIRFLHYPLDSPIRRPLPGGGLFSNSAEMTTFCRMILNGGELDGKHYVSQESIAQMGSRQTPPHEDDSYGLGWTVSPDGLWHGGAYSTGMYVFPTSGYTLTFHTAFAQMEGPGDKCRWEVDAAVKAVMAAGR